MRETRNINAEINTVEDCRHVEGYALVFNVESRDLGGFVEVIDPHALDGVISRSDVFALLDHDIKRGVLARCEYGNGSLTLSIDAHGLHYEFDAPKTALGEELIEGILRGDIKNSSFSFTCENDEWVKRADGTVQRTIKQIGQLFDISPVYNPAYFQTEVVVDKRGLEALLEQDNTDISYMKKKNKENRSREELIAQLEALMADLQQGKQEECSADEVDDTPENEEVENKSLEDEQEPAEDTEEVENNAAEDEDAEEVEDAEPAEDEAVEDKEVNKRNHKFMKKFSLINAINEVVNNRGLSDVTAKMNAEGRSIMNRAGIAPNGAIVLPLENRDGSTPATPAGIVATVATQGKENVATDKLNILEPLRANSVLAKAGATYLTGLVGDVSIPVYSGSNVGWKGEVVSADNGAGGMSEVVLKPKRLTAYIDVSKQFLIQDSNDAENMLRRDLVAAIAEKLEQTVLGAEAGTDNKPAGMFNGITADTTAFKFADVVDMEAQLDEANVNGAFTYILSPKAKAIMRKTSKDTGSGFMVMENGEVEGTPALCTSAVVEKGAVVGDFRDLVVGVWGALDITVDTISQAVNGNVRIVVNFYTDAVVRRPSAFAKRILK